MTTCVLAVDDDLLKNPLGPFITSCSFYNGMGRFQYLVIHGMILRMPRGGQCRKSLACTRLLIIVDWARKYTQNFPTTWPYARLLLGNRKGRLGNGKLSRPGKAIDGALPKLLSRRAPAVATVNVFTGWERVESYLITQSRLVQRDTDCS